MDCVNNLNLGYYFFKLKKNLIGFHGKIARIQEKIVADRLMANRPEENTERNEASLSGGSQISLRRTEKLSFTIFIK